MSKYLDIRSTLLALSGNQNAIVVHKAFVEFTGCLEAGMMLGQLLYWTPRAKNGVIAKSTEEWTNELCLSQYAVRKARKVLEDMGVLETELRKWAGAPTVHYRLRLDELDRKWILWIRKMDLSKSQNPFVENDKSITETTTETTTYSANAECLSETAERVSTSPDPAPVDQIDGHPVATSPSVVRAPDCLRDQFEMSVAEIKACVDGTPAYTPEERLAILEAERSRGERERVTLTRWLEQSLRLDNPSIAEQNTASKDEFESYGFGEAYRQQYGQTKGMRPPQGDEPWLTWGGGRVRARSGIDTVDLQRIGWIVEDVTGMRPTDGEWAGWMKALVQMYQAAAGDFGRIRRGVELAWEREEKFRPGHPMGFVKAIRKVNDTGESSGPRPLAELEDWDKATEQQERAYWAEHWDDEAEQEKLARLRRLNQEAGRARAGQSDQG